MKDSSKFIFTHIAPDLYDIKLVFRDGTACEISDVAIYEDTDLDLTPQFLLKECPSLPKP